MADAHKNFAYSTITGTTSPNGSDPGNSGTTITVQYGQGALFPPVPFNATIWPTGVQPTLTGNTNSTAEIVRVTNIQDDTLTVIRADGATGEPNNTSVNRTIVVGDQIAAGITDRTIDDVNDPITYWSPLDIAGIAQTGWQTLGANYTTVVGTNSLFVFPVTIPPNLQFNQVLLGASLSMVTSNVSARNSYYSKYGLYSMNGNTALSLISSSSFSILETMSSASLTWNYPTTTATSGYGTGSQFAGAAVTGTGQQSSYISGSRLIGLQFGGDMTMTGGQYYIGLLTQKSTFDTRSTFGFSLAGIQGQPVNPINMASGSLMPIGSASTDWQANNSNQTQWWGRHLLGFVTATSLANFGGTAIPSSVALSAIGTTGGAGSTATILPAVTFVST
jgi:hypothetical protein